jgi:uncharacterized membrane protein YbhN (UPF0104 family)
VNKRALWTLFKYVIAVGLLAVVVWRNWGSYPTDPNDRGLGYVWQHHVVDGAPVHYGYLALAFLFLAPAVTLTFIRWYVLVRAVGLPFTMGRAMHLSIFGYFFSTFLPGSVGGDIVKAAGIAREQSRRTVAVATVIMDRLVGLWGLFWLVALLGGGFWLADSLGGPHGEGKEWSELVVGSSAAVVVASVLGWLLLGLLPEARATRFADRLAKLPKIGGSAAEFWRAVWMYRRRPRGVALALLLSWVGFFGFILSFYYGALAFGDGDPAAIPTVSQHFLLVPVGLIIQAVVPLPGGIGASEIGFGQLYVWFRGDQAGPNGVLASLVYRLVSWTLSLGAYLAVAGRRRPAAAPAPAAVPAEEPVAAAAAADDGRWAPATSEHVARADATTR